MNVIPSGITESDGEPRSPAKPDLRGTGPLLLGASDGDCLSGGSAASGGRPCRHIDSEGL
jgi:hypothetical protein